MAKKSRRARRSTGKKRSPAPPAGVRPDLTLRAAESRGIVAPGATSGAKKIDFSQEYRYVYSDLKRIAILAASMLVVLVALSFVIR